MALEAKDIFLNRRDSYYSTNRAQVWAFNWLLKNKTQCGPPVQLPHVVRPHVLLGTEPPSCPMFCEFLNLLKIV